MSLTISLDTTTLDALSKEAAARNTTCEQMAREMIEEYFDMSQSPGPEYDAWFRAKYEEGIAAYKRGDICSHEDVQADMAERRKRFMARLER